ncbi:hypothetical protein AWZ03_004590 [Drosophila navojoa]|uniref:Uncharacterized protein n=1 Tax=Drosophila navojoa TaxID=7232 RepID=A0A484BJ67_DRONA|nr:hypothetical protein AWZ03_004590 [Drosophila navojoa]
MSVCPQLQLLLLLLVLVAAADSKSIAAQQELRQAHPNPNRVVLELPTINFTRIYNERPLMQISRLYNRLFNSTKEKPEANNVHKEDEEEAAAAAAAARRQQSRWPYPWNDIYDPVSGRQLNVQIPNQANGQQFYGSLGGFNYGAGAVAGLGFGTGTGQGYGFTFPGYPQIFGSGDYNKVPTVQVFEQSGFGIGSPSNYYNLIATNNDQLNDVLAPYQQWVLQQQLLSPQPALPYDGGLDYGEELEDVEVDNDFGYDKDDDEDEDEYDLDEYDDYGDGQDEDEDELWRQADADSKVKRKKNQNKIKSKSKSGKKKRKQQRVTK